MIHRYGYLESQLRKLVEKLEMNELAGLEIAQPCVKTFGPTPTPGVCVFVCVIVRTCVCVCVCEE